MSRPLRLFVSVNLPAEERRAIRVATAPLRESAAGVTWVTEECLHLTMKFLGEQPSEQVPALCGALGEVAARFRAFSVDLDGVGAFPGWRAPKIVWVGVVEAPPLELLYNDVEAACAGLGYEVDGKPFRPHITIGRVRKELSRAGAHDFAGAARAVQHRSVVPVRTVDLMSSELTPRGPRHRLVAALPLRSE